MLKLLLRRHFIIGFWFFRTRRKCSHVDNAYVAQPAQMIGLELMAVCSESAGKVPKNFPKLDALSTFIIDHKKSKHACTYRHHYR